jgi:MULE transposase domain
MQTKTEAAYFAVFQFLKEKYGLDIRSAMTDYELAIRNSLKSVFPEVDVGGCLFHYKQVKLNSNFFD